jgi:hypothetical protein
LEAAACSSALTANINFVSSLLRDFPDVVKVGKAGERCLCWGFVVAKPALGRAMWLGYLDPSAQWALNVKSLTSHIGEALHQYPKGQSLRQPLCFFFRKLEAS